MASDIRVEINPAGARAVMNSQGVQNELLRRAMNIADAAESVSGSGVTYAADVQPGRNRAHALVKTTDRHSRASNAKHNSLLKALDAGRG